jgi:hypothetical protein
MLPPYLVIRASYAQNAHAVALVQKLCYELEYREFDSR